MDGRRFDQVVRSLQTSTPRRGVLWLLAALSTLPGLLSLLSLEDAEAKDRRKRRRQRSAETENHKHEGRRRKHKPPRFRRRKRRRQRRKKKQARCKPQSTAQTCANTCGLVQNNCGETVDCGPCCQPPCGACFTCETDANGDSMCVVDPAQQGEACGEDGQVCQPDGSCACDATSCPGCLTCQGDGTCGNPCGGVGCCDNDTCVSGEDDDACGMNGAACVQCSDFDEYATCSAGGTGGNCICTSQASCPAGFNCGTAPDGCGGTLNCGVCGGTTPICVNNVCTACSQSNPCPVGQVCCGGECFTGVCCAAGDCAPSGDMCASNLCRCGGGSPCSGSTSTCCGTPAACTNTNTDAANCGSCGNACTGETPICLNGVCVAAEVCTDDCMFTSVAEAVAAVAPGGIITILEGEYVTHVNVFKDVTLRGADVGVTILSGAGEGAVMETRNEVRIEDMTITGGAGEIGGAILNRGKLTLVRVLVTGNSASAVGGGITSATASGPGSIPGELILGNSHVTFNTAPSGSGGGIAVANGQVTLTNGSTVTNNSAGDAGGILVNGGSVTLEPGSRVCGNSETQCVGFTPPAGFCGACP
jgi:hypothetical protein